ncbi:hypothetical protein V1517DRAFT_317843 [Lipomyces orientalis]|uniref:Uncharacterized protein n=1 Tax=Lipomyces orientalis TaxID=1233043 RepID=A0ACC3TSZ9_9ASCO
MALVHIPQPPGWLSGKRRPGVHRDFYCDLSLAGSTFSFPQLSSSNTDDLREKKVPISVRILGNKRVGKMTIAEEMLNIARRNPTYLEARRIAGDETADDKPCSATVDAEYGHGDRIFSVLERWYDLRLRSILPYAKKGHVPVRKDVRAAYFGVDKQAYVVLPTSITVDSMNAGEGSYKENVIILVVDATKPALDSDTVFRIDYFLRRNPVGRIIVAVNKMDLVVESVNGDATDASVNGHESAGGRENGYIRTNGNASPSGPRIGTRRDIHWRDLLKFGPESRFNAAADVVGRQIRDVESKLKSYEGRQLELVFVPTVAINGDNVNYGVLSHLCHWYQGSTLMEVLEGGRFVVDDPGSSSGGLGRIEIIRNNTRASAVG